MTAIRAHRYVEQSLPVSAHERGYEVVVATASEIGVR
jgi:hypothetical protein